MTRETVLRKRKRDLDKTCTTYRIIEPSYKFILETCDELEATIRDSHNNLLAVLTLDTPTTIISRKGNYNICIVGEGVGIVYAEWTSGGVTPEDCCEEMRDRDTQLQNQITNITNRLDNQNITGGTNISVTKTGDSYTISSTVSGKETTLIAGANVTITDGGTEGNHIYTVSASGGGGGGLPADFAIEGGTNVTVNKSGNKYTISSTDTNTQTTLVEGTNVTITDTGTGGNHVYTISSADTNTQTTLVEGTNVTITDTGTGGNHVYTISASGSGGGLPTDFAIEGGTNVTVNKSGNKYTISATDTDTITTVKQGTNVTVTKNGNEYTVSATDTDTKPVLVQAITSTCDIGGIASGTVYPVGTPLETILRDLLNCTPVPPQPTVDYPWFTSEVTNTSTWTERWNEFAVSKSAGTHTFNLARTYEEVPVKFDIPASLAPLTLELYNDINARWEVNTRDFAITNITRNIDGENVAYLRYTDAREVNAGGRPVRMTWNP